MTYTVSGANFNKDVAAQGTSINYKENKAVKSEGVAGSFAGVVISGGVTAATDNTYEGLLKEADDVKSQIMASASGAKLSLKALMMKLSGADAVKLDEDGFNLTDATPDDMVNIIEKIKIELAMHSDDYVNYGTAVSKDKIESVTGSAATAASVESRMQGADIAVNDESVAEVKGTLEKSKELKPLSENTKNYMVANGIEPSIAGIYQAQAATSSSISADGVTIGRCVNAISDADFEALRPGIEKIIASSGLEVNDNILADARAFIDAQIPVTKENLEYKAQLDAIFTDIYPDAVKIGMVASKELIETIADALITYKAKNIVLDPVMVSTSGSRLIKEDAAEVLKERLMVLADVITPNIPETEVLTGMTVDSADSMEKAAIKIYEHLKTKGGNAAVLVKGGHAVHTANDCLCVDGSIVWLNGERIDNPNTHGTGCTLSSAIAANLAQGLSIEESVKAAKEYLTGALKAGLNFGSGSGPLDHTYWLDINK